MSQLLVENGSGNLLGVEIERDTLKEDYDVAKEGNAVEVAILTKEFRNVQKSDLKSV